MKSFEINALGLEEMSEKDSERVNGGIVGTILAIIGGISAFAYIYDNKDRIKEGWEAGYNS